MIENYLIIAVLFFVGAVTLFVDRRRHSNHIKFLYIAAIVLYAAHLVPKENLPEHPIILVPIVAILAGYGFSMIYNNAKTDFTKCFLLLLVPVMILFVLLANGPQWVDITGDRTPIQEIDEMASYIKDNTPTDGKLLTLSTYVAVQADRELLPGLSQAYYTYRPDWSDEKAREFNGVNNNLLSQYIKSRNASAVLFTNLETRRILGDEPIALIKQYYDLAKTTGAWGQYSDTAYIYLPKKVIASVEKLRVNYGDVQTWSTELPPNTSYTLTLRSPSGGAVIALGSGNVDVNGEASGSFILGGNLPAGATILRIELASDPSIFDERTFFIEGPPGSITLKLEKSDINYDDVQTWSASGLVPYESYLITVRSLENRVVVLGSGNADANGNAGGSFVVGRNLAPGDNILRVEVASLPSYYSESTFRIS